MARTIHVWYIYLHLPQKSTIHVGKYTIYDVHLPQKSTIHVGKYTSPMPSIYHRNQPFM